jgi:hypothetical protein
VTTTAPRPHDLEITAFVDRVRTHLTGLSQEERDDLTGGLEADLAEQLADRDGDATWVDLGDPRAYAAELRLAAGLPAATRRLPLTSLPLPQVTGVEATLDACRAGFHHAVASHRWTAAVWDVVRELGPAWWAVRAWIALAVFDAMRGHPVSLVPSFGHPVVAFTALATALLLSVLLGLGRLQPAPGHRGHLAGRLLGIALNVVVVAGACTLYIPMPGYMVSSNSCM